MLKICFFAFSSLLILSCTGSRSVSEKPKKFQTGVIAHRGAWKNTGLPQNSVGALRAAIEMGCYGSEIDVHMTADGFIVANHDAQFHDLDIQNSNLVDLRAFQLSNGDVLPLLGDFLKVISGQSATRLIIEIKPSVRGKEWALKTAETVTREVEKFGAGARVEYISFDFDICREVVKHVPGAKVQYLNGDKTPEQVKEGGLTGIDYHLSVFRKHPNYFRQSRQEGITTNAWTVNEAADMDWLIDQKIDFITTDEPEELIRMLKALEAGS